MKRNKKNCNVPNCQREGSEISRLSLDGILIPSGKKTYSFGDAYKKFNYCKDHHDKLMEQIWNMATVKEDKK